MGDSHLAAAMSPSGGVGIFTHPMVLGHRPSYSHVEAPDRFTATFEAVRRSTAGGEISYHLGRRASLAEMMLVHDRGYLDTIAASDEDRQLDGDTYLCPQSFDAAAHAVGCVLCAVDCLVAGELGGAFCLVRPPGHHAHRDRAAGFCLLNNAAIGARYAQCLGLRRVMIVDFDAHHGDGTQSIFEQDSSVLYFSTHQYPTYPGSGDSSEIGRGSGEGYTLNEPLPPGSGDDAFSEVYRNTLPQCMARFKPNLVIVSAGYDVHGDDPLTELTLTDGGVRQIVRSILRASREVGCTTLFTLEGGYDIPALARCTVLTLEEMLFSASGESLSSS